MYNVTVRYYIDIDINNIEAENEYQARRKAIRECGKVLDEITGNDLSFEGIVETKSFKQQLEERK